MSITFKIAKAFKRLMAVFLIFNELKYRPKLGNRIKII